jgi:hypothetical protein
MPDHTAFAELLRALARERARTLVIGGLAKRLHGEVTDAYDHCLWYDADEENAARVYRALSRVGAPLDGIEVPDLADVGGPARNALARRPAVRDRPSHAARHRTRRTRGVT